MSETSRMFFTFRICEVCDRRFVTDTGFDSHLTKHNSTTEQGPAAELRPDPGSQDRDVNRGPGLERHQSRDDADDQGEELPLPAGAETLQGSPGVANLGKSSADQLIKDKQDVRQIIDKHRHDATRPGIELQDNLITSSSETAEPGDRDAAGSVEVKRSPTSGNPDRDQQDEREAVNDSGGSRFECRSCKEDFSSRSLLKEHTRNCKMMFKPKCNFCGETFDLNIRLYRHHLLKHGEQLGDPNQNGNQSQNSDKARTGQTTLSRQQQQYTCSICNKGFAKNFDYKLHNIKVHGKNELEQCSERQKDFVTQRILDVHTRSGHPDMKAFKCFLCPKSYTQKNGLKYHIDSFHKRLRPYKCDICYAAFTLDGGLKRHLKHNHDSHFKFKRS